MQRISWQDASERCYVIGPGRQAIARVSPGKTFIVETLDAFGDRVTGSDTPPSRVLSPPYENPVTGPIFVEGAEKGDTRSVTIQAITPARDYGSFCRRVDSSQCSGSASAGVDLATDGPSPQWSNEITWRTN